MRRILLRFLGHEDIVAAKDFTILSLGADLTDLRGRVTRLTELLAEAKAPGAARELARVANPPKPREKPDKPAEGWVKA